MSPLYQSELLKFNIVFSYYVSSQLVIFVLTQIAKFMGK